jgi:hypothetical protein
MSIKVDSLSPYAPIRRRGLHWWKYAILAGKDGHVTANGMISAELPQMIENYLMASYIKQFHEFTMYPGLFGYPLPLNLQYNKPQIDLLD